MDIDALAQLVHDDLGMGRAALHLGHHVAFELQCRDQPDHLALREGERLDQLGQIIFQELLAIGLEEGDGVGVVGRIAGGQAEIDLLAILVDRHALQPGGGRLVLDIGEGHRVQHLEMDLAVGARDIFVEQVFDTLGIDAVTGRGLAEPLRIIQLQRDRLVDLAEHRLGAVGQAEQLLVGQVDMRAAEQLAGQHIDGGEQDGGQHQAERRHSGSGTNHRAAPNRPS